MSTRADLQRKITGDARTAPHRSPHLLHNPQGFSAATHNLCAAAETFLNRRKPRHIRLHIELALEHPPILSRHYLDELARKVVPAIEDAPRDGTPGVLMMPHQKRVNLARLGCVRNIVQLEH